MYLRKYAAAVLLALVFALPSAVFAEEAMQMSYKWDVSATYPNFGDERIDEQIGGWLEEKIGKCMEEVKDGALAGREGSWEMSTKYEITRPSDKAASVIFEHYYYPSGAAHPIAEKSVLNFSTVSGKRLELDDLFEDPAKALELFAAHAPRLLATDLKEDIPHLLPEDIDDDFFFAEGLAPDRDNYSCLGLEPEGVRVYFQQYQILPYVFGMRKPLYTLDLLEPAGPKSGIWAGR